MINIEIIAEIRNAKLPPIDLLYLPADLMGNLLPTIIAIGSDILSTIIANWKAKKLPCGKAIIVRIANVYE